MQLTGADLDTLAAGTAGVVLVAAVFLLRRRIPGAVMIGAGTMMALSLVRYVLTG